MSLIGLETVASVALSAVNLRQTLKLKADVKQLRLEVKNGFIDLKQALESENREILKRIDRVAQDVEYRQHRTILIQAYGRFLQAIECLRDGLKISDINLRNTVIGNAQKMLYDALADYKNPLLYDNINTPGQLRRKECTWAIEQTLIMTCELQCAYETAIDRLVNLQNNICEYLIELITNCNDENELDFLFSEATRINNHDLLVLENWQHNLDYLASLSSEETKIFTSSKLLQVESTEPSLEAQIVIEETAEEKDYRYLKTISHFAALKDNFKFTMQSQLRKEYENYIIEQCRKTDRLSLAPTNLSELPNITIANLYWYLSDVIPSRL